MNTKTTDGGARRGRSAGAVSGRVGNTMAALLVPLALLASLTGAAAGLQESGLLARILADDDAEVRLEYRTRAGVELCTGGGIRIRKDGRSIHRTRWSTAERCRPGPAIVRLGIRDGRLARLELGPAVDGGPRGGRELGRVRAAATADALLTLARRSPVPDAAEDAIVAALVADSARVWPTLLEMARDRALASDVRKAALFWTGQIAAERAAEGLQQIVALEDDDLEVREAAVFSLSQLPADQAVPVLVDVARTAPHPRLRRSAFFWLAQSDDPRVVPFFEEVLSGSDPGR